MKKTVFSFFLLLSFWGCESPSLMDRLKWDAAKNWEIAKMAIVFQSEQSDSCRIFLNMKFELKQIWDELNRAYPARRFSGQNFLILEFYKQPWSNEPTARVWVDDKNVVFLESDIDKHRYQCPELYYMLLKYRNQKDPQFNFL